MALSGLEPGPVPVPILVPVFFFASLEEEEEAGVFPVASAFNALIVFAPLLAICAF